MRFRIPAFVLLLGLAQAPIATAAIFTVGPASSCTHTTLQAALDSAANNSGADVVRIVRTATWNGIQASTNTDQDVEIVGGWTTCTSQQPTGNTVLDGSGGQARSVIALRGSGDFTLRNLEIRGGDQAGDDDGGGVHFHGSGILRIIDSVITENSADEGGGLYAHGITSLAEVILENTVISYNTARNHGGGALAQELEMTIRGVGSAIMFNSAGGSGGGLFVRSGDRGSYAYVSGGLFGVQGNTAAIGGGIAVETTGDDNELAEVQVFSTTGEPVLIANNVATERGGGIHVQPRYDPGIGSGFPGSETTAVAQLRNVDLRGNRAPVGAAIHLSHDNWGVLGNSAMGGGAYFNVPVPVHALNAAAAPCPVGRPCGYIRDNTTGNTTGAVIHLSEDARFVASRVAFQDNDGGWLMYLSGEESTRMYLDNTLITGNSVQNALIRDDQNEDSSNVYVSLDHATIADNTIGANGVLSINEDFALRRSIVDQPGKAIFASNVGSSGGSRDIQHVIAIANALPSGVTYAVSRFVDRANGDYMPMAGARAVDFAPTQAGGGVDLFGHARAVDVPVNPNEGGLTDVGALERPYLQPLVLNADFDVDLRQWETLAPSARDATQNVTGPAGSGSLQATIGVDQARVAVRRQCIHLPGPGLYALDGWGRATGVAPFTPPNRVWLDWELRYSTATIDGCTNAPTARTGSLLLSSGSTWATPVSPAFIDVPADVWGMYTTLTVYLVVQNGSPIAPTGVGPEAVLGGPSGWFDGITLSTDFDDTIFSDGFD